MVEQDNKSIEDRQGITSSKTYYNYKGILTGNSNLNEIVDNGDNLFFDCPPIHYNDADREHIRGFSNSVHKNDYYVTIDKKGNKIRPNSPKVVPKIVDKYDSKLGHSIKV